MINMSVLLAITIFSSPLISKEHNKTRANIPASKEIPSLRKETHTGKAYLDENKKKLIYTEKHTATYRDGKILNSQNDYFDIKGQKIAELNSNYFKSLVMPTYVFQDLRTGLREGLRWKNDQYLIFKKEPGKNEEINTLDNVTNVFSCQGWHYYIVANLERIKKKPLEMKLIFPSKLDYYSFRIRPLKTMKNILKIRLEFDSWFIRLFAPHLDITYDQSTNKIIQYYGPSNILDEGGDIQNVHIYYE